MDERDHKREDPPKFPVDFESIQSRNDSAERAYYERNAQKRDRQKPRCFDHFGRRNLSEVIKKEKKQEKDNWKSEMNEQYGLAVHRSYCI